MADLNLRLVIQAIDQVTKPVRDIGRAIGNAVGRIDVSALTAGLSAARERIAAVGKQAREAGKSLREMGENASKWITAPAVLVGGLALAAFGRMESLETSFKTMLGDADKAKAMVASLADFASRTPFEMQGISGAARQLLSFGVVQDQIIPKLTMLGDIAAGANVPLDEMASIYGKAKSKGKAMTEELLQLSDRGIPIIDVLAKGLNVAKERVFDLAQDGKISFAILEKAMGKMTSKGGIFFDQMDAQSKTLFGKWSTLKDDATNALSVIGEAIANAFDIKGGMDRLSAWIKSFADWIKAFAAENPALAKIGILLVGVAAAIGPVLMGLGLMVSTLGIMASGFSVLLGPVGLVLAAIAALAAGAYLVYDNWEGISAFFTGLWASVTSAIESAWGVLSGFFEDLWKKIRSAFDEGFLQGVVALLEAFNPATLMAKGVNALIAYLFGIDLAAIGSQWIGGLSEGMASAWSSLTAWLGEAVTSLLSWMPDWVKERLGVGGAGQVSGAPAAPAVPTAIQPNSLNVGGRIGVDFSNMPKGAQVNQVKSDNPAVPIDYTAGYAMAGL